MSDDGSSIDYGPSFFKAPTASLTTAARHLYEALACTDGREMEAIEAAFAEVRRDALEEAAKIAETLCSTGIKTNKGKTIVFSSDEGIAIAKAIRALSFSPVKAGGETTTDA